MKPPTLVIISRMTSFPRRFAGAVSVCQIGAVAVLMPLPMPNITRPTNICARLNELVFRMTPTDMIAVPMTIDFLRPSLSPMVKATIAPMKQPTSYMAARVDKTLVREGPTRSCNWRKFSLTTTPEKTPWNSSVSDPNRHQMILIFIHLVITEESHVCRTSDGDPEYQPSSLVAEVSLLGRKQHGVRV
jgi:hypothetical protein